MKELLANPVARREFGLLRRRWISVLLIAVLAWLPLQYLTRSLWHTGGMMLGFWQSMATYVLILMYRPDLLLGFIIVATLATEARWWRCREELCLTRLEARPLALGMLAVPLLLLALLHLVAAPMAYRSVFADPNLLVGLFHGEGSLVEWMPRRNPVRGVTFHLGWVILPFAILEDIFYAALVLLVAMNQYLLRRDALRATFVGFFQMTLISLGIAACSFVYYAVTWAMSDETFVLVLTTPTLDFLLGNASWFLSVLPLQFLVGLFLWRRLVRRLRDEFLNPWQ